MKINRTLARLALVTSLFMVLAAGCASSSQVEQPPMTTYMKLSPLAPPEASHIRKVGNQWQCEVNGQKMKYNPATGNWEPMVK